MVIFEAVGIYCHVLWSDYGRGFGLTIEFIDHFQIVTTNNYNIVAISTLYKITLSLFQPTVSSLAVSW
jgi:hypothetical protein